ncbi:MAG: hypothetical protein ACI9OJ_002927 [Myxococcota bacterium]
MADSKLHALYREASVDTLLDVLYFKTADYSEAARLAAREVLAERGEDPESLLIAAKQRVRDAADKRRAKERAVAHLAAAAHDVLLEQARAVGSCLQCRRRPEECVIDANLRRGSPVGSVTMGAEEFEVFDVVSLPIPLCAQCAGVEKRRESNEFRSHIGLFAGGVITTILFQVVFKPSWAAWWTGVVVMAICYVIAAVYDARRTSLVELHPATAEMMGAGYEPSPTSSRTMTPATAYRHLIETDANSIAALQAERSLIALGNAEAIDAAHALENDPATLPAALRILAALGQ